MVFEWLLIAVTIQNHSPSIVVSLTRSDEVDAGMTVETVLSLILNAIGTMTNGSSILKHNATRSKTKIYLQQLCFPTKKLQHLADSVLKEKVTTLDVTVLTSQYLSLVLLPCRG